MKNSMRWLRKTALLLCAMLILAPGLALAATRLPAWPTSVPLYGVNFGAFDKDPNIISNTVNVSASLARLKALRDKVKWVRFFALDRGQKDVVLGAKKLGFKVAAGAWISSDAAASQEEVDALIALIARGKVDLAVVGNEVLDTDNGVTAATLIGYIEQVKKAAKGRVPVTSAATPGVWTANPALLSAVDVVGLNVYPFWEKVSIDDALASFTATYSAIKAAAGSKQVVITETGWPSEGGTYGAAVCSVQNAQRYLDDVSAYTLEREIPLFYFEAYDEPWKAAYEQAFGAHWGIYNASGARVLLLYPTLRKGAKGEAVQRLQARLVELGYLAKSTSSLDKTALAALTAFQRACAIKKPVSYASTYVQLRLYAPDAPKAAPTLTPTPTAAATPGFADLRYPAYGASGYLKGKVTGMTGASYVVVYIQVEGSWWVKPYFDSFITYPDKNGYFSVDVDTGGLDEFATSYDLYLLSEKPTSYDRFAVAAKAIVHLVITR